MKTLGRLWPQAFAIVLLSVLNASAQTPLRFPRESQKASVMQTIGVTDVTVTYSRPAMKGRKIWGEAAAEAPAGSATLDDPRLRPKDAGIVTYGRVWRTGANEATVFKVSDDVLVQGQMLAAGSYSLHTIPGRDEWTIIFNRDDGQWGSFSYDEKKDALRVKTKPQAAPDSQEWLSFQIEPAGANSARVVLRWEKVAVPFTVEVKDVNGLALQKAREAIAARPDDPQIRVQAANFAIANKLATDEAMRWLDESIRIKETFGNLSSKARALAAQGKTAEAVAAGERALQVGRAANVNAQALADFEKRVAEWKAKQ